MRPHVELVDCHDLIDRAARLPEGTGAAAERRLCADEETGGGTVLLRFDTDWSRPGGRTASDTSWYLIRGDVTLDGFRLGEGAFWRVPCGASAPAMRVSAGCVMMHFRSGDYSFSPARHAPIRQGSDHAFFSADGLVGVHSGRLPWKELSPSSRDTDGSVCVKELATAEAAAFASTTHLVRLPAKWTTDHYLHSTTFTEAFVLSGVAEYNFGTLSPGRYLFRPERIKHGEYRVGADPLVLLVRRGSPSRTLTTDRPYVSEKSRALSFDPDDVGQSPRIGGMAVRSRSLGEFASTIR